jgi:predicted transcriptional regulator
MPMADHSQGSPYSPETKIAAAVMLAAGKTYKEITAELGPTHVTLWRWVTDDAEFHAIRTRLTDAVIAANVQQLRALSTKAIEALERGLDSDTRQQAVVKGGEVEIVELRDDSLAVRAADLTLKRIGEFAEQSHVDVSGSLLEHWMGELDGDGDGAEPLPG